LSRISPKGGLRTRGGGIVTPGGGLLAAPPPTVGITKIATIDLSTPVTQTFGSVNATHKYLLQELSGNYADTGTGTTADIDTFTAGLQGQSRPGIWDGSSYTAIKAWETDGATSRAAVSNVSVFDSDDTDLYFRIEFAISEAPAVAAVLTEKRTGVAAGWRVEVQTDGTIDMIIEDASSNTVTVSLAGDHCDAAPHYLEFFYDDSEDELTVNSDVDAGNAATTTAAVTGSLTNAVAWRLGDPDSGVTAGLMQVFLAEGAEGAAAATMFAETGWWTHGTDPTGLMSVTNRATTVTVPVSATQMASFAGGATLATCQLPIAYHANLSVATKLGLFGNGILTNRITYSEKFSQWTQTGTSTTVDNQTSSPSGFKNASLFTAGADNDFITSNAFATSSTWWMTMGVWVKESTVGVTGRIIWWNSTGAAEEGSKVFTATGDWQWIPFDDRATAGNVNMSMKIEIDTNGESVYVWGATNVKKLGRNYGDPPYLRTDGGTETSVDADYHVPSIINAKVGEIRSIGVAMGNANLHAGPWNTSTLTNLRGFSTTNGNLRTKLYDNLTVSEDESPIIGSPTRDVEYTHRVIWTDGSDDITGGFKQLLIENGVTTEGGALPWTGESDDTLLDMHIMSKYSGLGAEWIMSTIESWDGLGGGAIP